MNNYPRRYRPAGDSLLNFGNNEQSTIMSRPRLSLRTCTKPRSTYNLVNLDPAPLCRTKRLKSRKINGSQKIDVGKKKTLDYTENAYREAVSKLKYLLAESYGPRSINGKIPRDRGLYRRSNFRINETTEDYDDRSESDCSRNKEFAGNDFEDGNACETTEKNRRLVGTSRNSALYPARDTQSSPSELTSLIARQEDYIEQLERESRYCKNELKNLLEKIREVVAENEALHDKNKANILKSFLRDYEGCDGNEKTNAENRSTIEDDKSSTGKKVKIHHKLEGPSIVFESRISELEAQLTQARIELKKARDDNECLTKRIGEFSENQSNPELKAQLERALREKREIGVKLEEASRNVEAARERENETSRRAKRATEFINQSDFDKYQAETEIRRLNDELERQRDKLRELSQECSRRVADERLQIERRYSQQVEQLSADVASHWDAAAKSQMEAEKQRRELAELKRDLAQKQSMIDDLKKELQNKISHLQSDLNQAIAEKDSADQEIAAGKLAAERNERQSRQEQNRCQAEINSYKQRLERADADIVHCRRENLRLSEQIASLEKELNVNKLLKSQPETETTAAGPKPEVGKDLTTMIMDIETKHAATVAGLEDVMSNQAELVARLTAECQSLTHRLEANDRIHKYYAKVLLLRVLQGQKPVDRDECGGNNETATPSKNKRTVKVDLKVKVTPKAKSISSKTVRMPLSAQEEMATLQSNLDYLSSRINDTIENSKAGQTFVSDRKNAQRENENGDATGEKTLEPDDYRISDYHRNPIDEFENENVEYSSDRHQNVNDENSEISHIDNPDNYAMPNDEKYNRQEYSIDNENYSNDYGNEGYDQYDPSLYQRNTNDEKIADQLSVVEDVYKKKQGNYQDHNDDNVHRGISRVDDQQDFEKSSKPAESSITEA